MIILLFKLTHQLNAYLYFNIHNNCKVIYWRNGYVLCVNGFTMKRLKARFSMTFLKTGCALYVVLISLC